MLALLLVVSVLLSITPTTESSGVPPGFTTCKFKGLEKKAWCGSIDVFEDHQSKKGRKFGVYTVIVPSKSGSSLPDPVLFLAGGPGEAVSELIEDYLERYHNLRENRDFLFVDQRGTGKSSPIQCKFHSTDNPQLLLGPLFPLDKVRQC